MLWTLEREQTFTADIVQGHFRRLSEALDVSLRNLTRPFYVAMSGEIASLPLFQSMEILGPDLVRAPASAAPSERWAASSGKRMKKLQKRFEELILTQPRCRCAVSVRRPSGRLGCAGLSAVRPMTGVRLVRGWRETRHPGADPLPAPKAARSTRREAATFLRRQRARRGRTCFSQESPPLIVDQDDPCRAARTPHVQSTRLKSSGPVPRAKLRNQHPDLSPAQRFSRSARACDEGIAPSSISRPPRPRTTTRSQSRRRLLARLRPVNRNTGSASTLVGAERSEVALVGQAAALRGLRSVA